MRKSKFKNKDSEIFFYQGPLSFDRITALLVDFEKIIKCYPVEKVRIKRLFSTAVEILENMQMHGVKYTEPLYPYFRVLYNNNLFCIESGNLMATSEVKFLQHNIDFLNQNFPSLTDVIKGNLLNRELSQKGGAGLGLYIVRRNSQGDIIYKSEMFDQNLSIFIIQVYI
ncbi:MAG TPA: DUF6272 family protein [Salinivirgaceae bacterium]|nr:DUF6272 family protein [Salinivirgaceae bacterium]